MSDTWIDLNGEVRLTGTFQGRDSPSGGKVIPVANATGVTVDTTTYSDTIKGSGKLTTLILPSGDQGLLAVALAGDAFPRWLLSFDPSDFGLYLSDGTVDPGQTRAGFGVAVGESGLQILSIQAGAGTSAPLRVDQVSPLYTITSGALPTVQLVSGTAAQILTTRDTETVTPCTFNPGVATTATVTVAISSDDMTYSTLGIETVPAGTALDGTIHLVKARVPAGWYLKLTANAQATLGVTTYY